MKRISFNTYEAGHLHELALEHFQEQCCLCETLKKRLEKFIGEKETRANKRIIKKNGYCLPTNHLM